MNTAGLNIVLGWDDAKVKKGVEDLKSLIKGLSVSDSANPINTTKAVTEIQRLKNSVKEAKTALDSFLAGGGSLASAQGQQLAQAYNSVNSQLNILNRNVKGSQDAYARLANIANQATRHAQNLGVQYGVTSDKFVVAAKRAQNLTEQLQQIDAATGRHQRNVGNYASGFNAIGTNMSRLIGEMPNFTQSMQLGFIAVSNNIQPLAESIQQLNAKNKELAAQGKPTESVLKSVGAALFSWNTLLLVGVSALVAYGPKMLEFIRGYDSAKASIDAANEALKDSAVVDATRNMAQLSYEIKLVKSGHADAQTVLDHFKNVIGDAAKNVKTLGDAEKWISDNAEKFVAFQIAKAKATLLYAEAAKAANDYESLKKNYGFFDQLKADLKSSGGIIKNVFSSIGKGQGYKFLDGSAFSSGVKGTVIFDEAQQKALDLKKAAEDATKEMNELSKAMSYNPYESKSSQKYKNSVSGAIKDSKSIDKVAENLSNLRLTLYEIQKEFSHGFITADEKDKKRLEALSSAYKKFLITLKQPESSDMMKGLFSEVVSAKNIVALNENKKAATDKINELGNELSKTRMKEIDKVIKENNDAYRALIEKTKGYYEKQLSIEEDFQKQMAGLERAKFTKSISNDEFQKQRNIIISNRNKLLDELKFDESDIFVKLNKDIGKATASELSALFEDISNLIGSGKMKNAVGEIIDIPPETLERLKQAKNNISELIKENVDFQKKAKAIGGIASDVDKLGEAIASLGDEKLGGAIRGVAFALSTLSNEISKFTLVNGKLQFSGSSLDAYVMAAKFAISAISEIIESANAQKKALEQAYISNISYQKEYNSALIEEIRLRQGVKESIFFTDYSGKIKAGLAAEIESINKYNEALNKLQEAQVITGSKKVRDWGKVLSSTASGAITGAIIGASGGVLSAVGGVIGGAVGFISGMLKKRTVVNVYGDLLETYPELIDKQGQLNTSMAQAIINSGKIEGSSKETLLYLISMKEQYEAAKEQIEGVVSSLVGSLGTDLMEGLYNDWLNGGKNAGRALGEGVAKSLTNLGKNLLFNAIFSEDLMALQNKIKENLKTTGDPNSMVRSLIEFNEEAKKKAQSYQDLLTEYAKQLKEKGITDNIGITGEEKTDLKSSIKASLTEETGSILAGNLMGIQVSVLDIRNFMLTDMKNYYTVSTMNSIETINLVNLIKADTKNIADNTLGIVPELKALNSKLSSNSDTIVAMGGV